MHTITLTEYDSGRRLDRYLLKYFDRAPASFVYKNLRKGLIKLNGRKASGDKLLQKGDEIRLFFSEDTLRKLSGIYTRAALIPGNPSLSRYADIVYEDSEIIAANKFPGVLSQKAGASDLSLNEALLRYCLEKEPALRESAFTPSVTNRLDRNVSGLVVFAKTYGAARELSRLFRMKIMEKYYLSAVEGVFDSHTREFSGFLTKNCARNIVRISAERTENSHPVRTEFELLRIIDYEGEKLSLVRVKLIGGRSHEIRASLSSLGHPVLGDRKYGSRFPAPRNTLFLHAHELLFPADPGRPLENLGGKSFFAEPPAYFREVTGGD